VVEVLDPQGGQPRAVGGDDLGGEVAESCPEVLAFSVPRCWQYEARIMETPITVHGGLLRSTE
jgi:hypothetical protein